MRRRSKEGWRERIRRITGSLVQGGDGPHPRLSGRCINPERRSQFRGAR